MEQHRRGVIRKETWESRSQLYPAEYSIRYCYGSKCVFSKGMWKPYPNKPQIWPDLNFVTLFADLFQMNLFWISVTLMFNNWNSYEHEEIWRHTDAHRRMQCEDRNRVVSWGATKRSSGNHHSWERQGGFFSRVFRSSMAWLLLQSCTARPKICETINRHCLKLLFVAPC